MKYFTIDMTKLQSFKKIVKKGVDPSLVSIRIGMCLKKKIDIVCMYGLSTLSNSKIENYCNEQCQYQQFRKD